MVKLFSGLSFTMCEVEEDSDRHSLATYPESEHTPTTDTEPEPTPATDLLPVQRSIPEPKPVAMSVVEETLIQIKILAWLSAHVPNPGVHFSLPVQPGLLDLLVPTCSQALSSPWVLSSF